MILAKDNPRDKLYQMLDDGLLDAATLARDLLGYLSWDECKEFAQMNDIPLDDDEEPEEDPDDEETYNEQNN